MLFRLPPIIAGRPAIPARKFWRGSGFSAWSPPHSALC